MPCVQLERATVPCFCTPEGHFKGLGPFNAWIVRGILKIVCPLRGFLCYFSFFRLVIRVYSEKKDQSVEMNNTHNSQNQKKSRWMRTHKPLEICSNVKHTLWYVTFLKQIN